MTSGEVLDVGCGAGDFVEMRMAAGFITRGIDVIPEAMKSLEERGLAGKLEHVHAMTMWDVLEHIERPEDVLQFAEQFVFVSIPIFKGYDHVRRSKHYKPTEHFHYFTHRGFVGFMWDLGFRLIEWNCAETEVGREDIRSFAFRRG